MVISMASSTGTNGTRAARGSGVGSFRSFRFHKERCTLVHLLLHTHFYLDKKNRRTQYHLSRNRAVLLVVCSVLNFSSRIRALLYSVTSTPNKR